MRRQPGCIVSILQPSGKGDKPNCKAIMDLTKERILGETNVDAGKGSQSKNHPLQPPHRVLRDPQDAARPQNPKERILGETKVDAGKGSRSKRGRPSVDQRARSRDRRDRRRPARAKGPLGGHRVLRHLDKLAHRVPCALGLKTGASKGLFVRQFAPLTFSLSRVYISAPYSSMYY